MAGPGTDTGCPAGNAMAARSGPGGSRPLSRGAAGWAERRGVRVSGAGPPGNPFLIIYLILF